MGKKLLWVGDAVVSTGFARSTHGVLATVSQSFETHALGLNFRGDPDHGYPYTIWPTFDGDNGGVRRMQELVSKLHPDVIVVQQDPWNFAPYIKRAGGVPMVGFVAVDGLNCRGDQLNGLAMAVFWTQFGEEQAKLGGYPGRSTVIPLGIDLDVYHQIDRMACRDALGVTKALAEQGHAPDTFIVGVVGRNQPRKRLDLTIRYFAQWVKECKVDDAVLWLHVAPTGEEAYDINQLTQYYGMEGRVVSPEIEPIFGKPEAELVVEYNSFDMLFSTTQGEGFWLPGFEAAACGLPIVAPNWSAVGELFADTALLVPCTSTAATLNGINVIGGVMDEGLAVRTLDSVYRSMAVRDRLSCASLAMVADPRYRWTDIGLRFTDLLEDVLRESKEMAFADLGREALLEA